MMAYRAAEHGLTGSSGAGAHPVYGAVHEGVWSLLLAGGGCQLRLAPFGPPRQLLRSCRPERVPSHQ